jgi:hypothetical protein
VAIQEVPDTEKIKHETNKIFLGFGASVIQRFYETSKIKPRFYFTGFLRFVCDMALTPNPYTKNFDNKTDRKPKTKSEIVEISFLEVFGSFPAN